MQTYRLNTIKIVAAVLLLTCAGCNSYEQKKQAARLRFDQAMSQAKIPLAWSLFEEGNIEDARQTIIGCLHAEPDNALANLLMGQIELVQGRLSSAERYLLTATEQNGNLHQGWAYLGVIAQENKQLAAAMIYHRKALELEPLNVDYIMSVAETYAMEGQYDQALSLLEEKSRFIPSQTRLKIAAADIKHRKGDIIGAIELYQRALLNNPDNTEVMESLGYCYVMRQQWTEAVEIFEKLVEKSSGARKTANTQLLAMCCMNDGKYGRAVTYYDKLSVAQRDDASLWLQMGQAALGSNSAARAIACAERALVLRPGWDEATALKGSARYLATDYTGAIETFNEIISSREIGPFARLMIGRCYQQLGQLTLAQRAYESAAKLNPDSKLVSLLTMQTR